MAEDDRETDRKLAESMLAAAMGILRGPPPQPDLARAKRLLRAAAELLEGYP